jgi:gliding motility-associated-like protein
VDIWILTQRDDGKFYAWLLTSNGWASPPAPTTVSSGTAPLPTTAKFGDGCMKPSNEGSKIAVAYGGIVAWKEWQIYDFNKSTGQLTQSLILPAPPGQKPYDISFSPNDKVLYATCWNTGCYQYNLAAGTSADIIGSQFLVGPAQQGIQLGPDGKIYISISQGDPSHLDVINSPDSVGVACSYALQAYTFPPLKQVLMVLPNIPMNVFLNKLKVNLGPDQTICKGTTLTLNPGVTDPGSSSFLWSDSSTAPTLTISDTGTYWVKVCDSYDTIKIASKTCQPTLEVPNIFTPNGDGANDLFSASVSENIESMETTIYDRWGKEVFKTANTKIDWDGKNKNGTEENDGTYFYMITYSGKDQVSHTQKGNLLLVR